MAKARKHRGRTHRGQFLGLYIFFTAVLVVLVIVAGCIVFFKVSNVDIYVRGAGGETNLLAPGDSYTQEEILKAAGIQIGDNLCLLNRNRTAINILDRLPYISSVSIRKSLPGTLTLTITESQAVAAIQVGEETWWLIDINGKLLEPAQDNRGYITVEGLTLLEPEAGQELCVPDGSDSEVPSQSLQKDSLIQLLPPLQDYDLLDDIVTISLTSESEVVLDYDSRIKVKLPLEADFDYMIEYFSSILTEYVAENWSDQDTGILDMTFSDGNPHLTKNT